MPVPSTSVPRPRSGASRSRGLRALALGAGLLVASALSACSDEPTAAPEEAKKPAEAPAAPAAEKPAAASAEEYSYNPIGKRDPFRSFIAREVVAPADAGDQLGPLQMWEVEQFRLVAIVWGDERPTAMVQDPEGIGHVIEVGSLIGKNWGRVTQIRPQEIVVTEEYRDEIENRLIVTENPIKLPSSDAVGARG